MEPRTFFLQGEIDVANADGLATTLRSVAGQQPGDLIVDCHDLAFIDAAGIRALFLVQCELAQQHRALRLVHPTPMLTRLLDILDITWLLHAEPLTYAKTRTRLSRSAIHLRPSSRIRPDAAPIPRNSS
jgi:anti-anti-sigma factor